jgi:hypothetical protein
VTDGGTVAGNDVSRVDPFDLPEWLGEGEVVWTAASALTDRSRVEGELHGPDGRLGCDVLAVDQAWPQPVVTEEWRRAAHGEWSRGEVLLVDLRGRLTAVVPGTSLAADVVLDVIGRLARSVGVPPSRFLVALRP